MTKNKYNEYLTQQGIEHDEKIFVEITEDDVDHCFRVHFNDKSFLFHARSLADLIVKASMAMDDWQLQSMAEMNKLLKSKNKGR